VSQDPADVIRSQFAATNARDFQRAMDLYADDVVLIVEEGFLNTGVFEGKEAVGEWFGDWFRAFGQDYHFDVEELRDLGGGVCYLFASYGGSGRTSGAEVTDSRSYLYRVNDGLIDRVQFFMDRDSALSAASLPEWSESKTD
jgi:ketosteroid isomerase-like protein